MATNPFEQLAQQLVHMFEQHNTVNARVNALELAVQGLCSLLEQRGIPAIAAMRATEAAAFMQHPDDSVVAALRDMADNIERSKAEVDAHRHEDEQP